jgi:hypothetical protein
MVGEPGAAYRCHRRHVKFWGATVLARLCVLLYRSALGRQRSAKHGESFLREWNNPRDFRTYKVHPVAAFD